MQLFNLCSCSDETLVYKEETLDSSLLKENETKLAFCIKVVFLLTM